MKTDVNAVQAHAGDNAFKGTKLELIRGYGGDVQYECSFDETAALKYLVGRYELPTNVAAPAVKGETVSEVQEVLAAGEQTEAVTELANTLALVSEFGTYKDYIVEKFLKPRIPKFLYFDEYYQMRGCENIQELKSRQANKELLPSDYPLLGLINRARLDLDELLTTTRTRELKNRLQGASNHLTKQIITYWSQNKHLRLLFDVREARRGGTQTECDKAQTFGARSTDTKHFVTTEMGTRSRGFIWFFSFLAWHGDVRDQGEKVILLLDEPGLSLHGKAQEDLLKFFEAEIRGQHQLIYTTHSPIHGGSDQVR